MFLYWAKGNVIFIPRWAMTICYQFCINVQTFKSQIDNKNQVAMLLSIIYIRVGGWVLVVYQMNTIIWKLLIHDIKCLIWWCFQFIKRLAHALEINWHSWLLSPMSSTFMLSLFITPWNIISIQFFLIVSIQQTFLVTTLF